MFEDSFLDWRQAVKIRDNVSEEVSLLQGYIREYAGSYARPNIY